MTELGVPPERVVMVGDTEYDIQMAHNAGTRSIAVSYGVHEKKRLQACRPHWCVDSLPELNSLFLGNGKGQGSDASKQRDVII